MDRQHAERVYFEQLKRTVPISAVLERYGILSDLKRVGSQLKGCCPIHQGSNSKQFVVDLNKGLPDYPDVSAAFLLGAKKR